MCKATTIERELKAAANTAAVAKANLSALVWPSPAREDKGAPAVYAHPNEDGSLSVMFQDCPPMRPADAARLGHHLIQNYDSQYEPPPPNETRIWLRRASEDRTLPSTNKLSATHIVGGTVPVAMGFKQIVPFMSTTALGRPVRPGDVIEVRAGAVTKHYIIESADNWLLMK